MSLGEAVRRLRKARKWTLTELERHTVDPITGNRLHAGTLGNIERDLHPNPTERTLQRLADAFGITVATLRQVAGLDPPATDTPELAEAAEVLHILRALPPDDRAAILQILRALSRQEPTL